MKLDPQDRPVPVLAPENHLFRWVALAAVVIVVALTVVVIRPARDAAKGAVFAAREALGVGPPDPYVNVYQRLGVAPFSARLRALSQISSGLERLAREPCDKRAIFALGEALLTAHEDRTAADAYAGFAAKCPNGDGEQYRAAEILVLLGDNDKAITIADDLVTRNPAINAYRYLRGKARAGAKRYAEALDDYKNFIELTKDQHSVGDWVFVEMANIYAAIGRPCEAATAIMAWVAIDPSVRDTPTARKKAEAYAAQGCAPQRPPETRQL
jgi:tetratricopeptide (TPR) repeat protein